jgi:hypothetical protein
MMNKIVSTIFFLTITVVSIAQTISSISGTVYNRQSKPIPAASLRILNAGTSAVADAAGYFKFRNIPVVK